jgi:phospholipid/cholesterol/gamma-HCH transport system permease protein
MTLVLVVVAGTVAFGTGMGAAYTFFGINPRTFANLSLVDAGDVIVGISKCIAYGAAIPVVSAHAGLTTFGGSAGVGAATTRAVVNSSLAVIALDFIISGIGYVVFGG